MASDYTSDYSTIHDVQYTRSGARRSGDRYQDIVALEILVSMLEHPEQFQWVRLEADDAGSLDDIVYLDANGDLSMLQVKYSLHPDRYSDCLTWDYLLEQPVSKKGKPLRSRLQKWADSLRRSQEDGKTIHASVVSNRNWVLEIASIVNQGFVEYDSIPSDVRAKIESQVNGEANARVCFGTLQFNVNRPNLEILKDGVRKRFANLGGTESGWNSLKDYVELWVTQKNLPSVGGFIRINDVRFAARWYDLKGLPQNFLIPDDFVVPSEEFHNDVLSSISELDGRCVVISGTPGVGKSTYISYLCEELKKAKCPTIRHHYFLSLEDRSAGKRFDADRVIESLMHDIQQDYLAWVSNPEPPVHNPNTIEFPDWLDRISEYATGKDYPFVIVIDGLDHVWRERDRNIVELTRLFSVLLPPRPGIIILIGTQPVDDSKLPASLLNYAPRDKWLFVPHFDRQAIIKWVEKHLNEFIPDRTEATDSDYLKQRKREIAESFLGVSEGHPLHLKYSLQSMRDLCIAFTEENIRGLPECSHEGIRTYYDALWRGLHDSGKFSLSLIVAGAFIWPETGLIQALQIAGFNPVEAMNEWRSVRHLLKTNELGWQPLHGSLAVFVRDMGEYRTFESQLKEVTLKWLESAAPSYWRWAHLWSSKSKWTDDSEPLLKGADRQWVIDSLAIGYPLDDVQRIISESAYQAFQSKDFALFAERALLCDYVGNYYRFQQEDGFERLRSVQLILLEDDRIPPLLKMQYSTLHDKELAALASYSSRYEDYESVEKCVNLLRNNLNTGGHHDHLMFGQLDMYIESLCQLPSYHAQSKSVVGDIVRNRKSSFAERIPDSFASALRRRQCLDTIRGCISSKLQANEKRPFLCEGSLLSLEIGADWNKIACEYPTNPYCAVYASLRDVSEFCFQTGYQLGWSLFKIKDYELYQFERQIGEFYHECFFVLLAAHLYGNDECRQSVINQVNGVDWRWDFIHKLDNIALDLTRKIKLSETISIAWFYDQIRDFPRLTRRFNDADFHFWAGAKIAFMRISFDCTSMLSPFPIVAPADLECIEHSQHCALFDWLDEYNDRGLLSLSAESLEWLSMNGSEMPVSGVWRAAENGSKEYAILATIFARHGQKDRARYHTRRSVDLGIVHGYHKDILIWDIFRSTRLIAAHNPEQARNIIDSVAPAIDQIGQFTDGKETRSLPDDYGSLLVQYEPDLITPFFLSYLRQEHYHSALTQFHNLLKALDYSNELHRAIGRTAVDQDSLDWMVEEASKGNENLKSLIKEISSDLCGIPQKSPKHVDVAEPENKTGKGSRDVVDVAIYPPSNLIEYITLCREDLSLHLDQKMAEWSEYWSKKDPHTVIGAILNVQEKEPYLRFGRLLYRLSREAQGRQEAYPYLVAHCREDKIWVTYWSMRDDEARGIMRTVVGEYPDKWFSFIADTLSFGNKNPTRVGIYHMFPRLIEFLLMSGHPREADDLLQGVFCTFDELVRPFKLPPVDWIGHPIPLSEAFGEVLFSRLEWPSGLVRERAIQVISELLADGTRPQQILDRFIQWGSKQMLETRAVLALIVLNRAKDINPSFILSNTQLDAIIHGKSSLLSEILQAEFSGKKLHIRDLTELHSETALADYTPYEDWNECRRMIYPKIKHNIESIAEVGKLDLAIVDRQWAFETEIVKNRNQYEFPNSAGDFWGRKDSEHHLGYENNRSETIVSGYLRTLSWALDRGIIRQDMAIIWAIQALPVDLDFLKIRIQNKPKWWPMVAAPASTSIDLVPGQILSLFENLLPNGIEDSYIGHLSGWAFETKDTHYFIEITGLFQACLGIDHPEVEAVKLVLDQNSRQLYYPVTPRFKGRYDTRFNEEAPVRVQDWLVLRASCFLMPFATLRYQGWRYINMIWAPAQMISSHPISFVCESEGLIFQDDEKIIGRWFDWADGLSELQNANLPLRTGSVLLIAKDRINEIIQEDGGTFCWLCEIKVFSRDHSIGEFKEQSFTHIIGAGKLIQSTQFGLLSSPS